MDKPVGGSSLGQQSSEGDHLELQLGRQFEELISRHPTLTIDEVFYLEASRLYIELIEKQREVI
jgi:hypothetical protein